MIGSKLGSYEIIEQVGQGGMSIVYRAYHPGTERHVAVKVITKMISSDTDAVQRFQREARLIARLEHPHILPVYDFDSGHNPPYLVMRFLHGGTLQELQRHGQLSLEETGILISQVCDALYYAHRQGIIHRDIKPSNILISREGHAFVADFGVARMVGDQIDKQITSTGVMVGTPDYMSPEQAYGRADVSHYADIYSLGVVLFELLTGRLPFVSDSVMGVVLKHMQEPAPSATAINPALPADIDFVLSRALSKEPTERYATAIAFSEAVMKALNVTGSQRSARLVQAAQQFADKDGSAASSTHTPSQTPTAQYKNLTVMNVNAAEYLEILEAWQGDYAEKTAVFWQNVEQIVNAHGGAKLLETQNTLLAFWGADMMREDDVERALQSALAIQVMLRQQAVDIEIINGRFLPLNITLHTDLALLNTTQKTNQHTVTGALISVANRLVRQAQGTILITHNAYNHVRGAFDVERDEPLKIYRRGAAHTLPVYRVLAAKALAFAVQIRGVEDISTPLIARNSELGQLQKAFLDVVEGDGARFITIVAEAGLGKSRLLKEFVSWVDLHPQRVRLLPGRATPDMQDRPYALLRQIISFRFDIHDNDTPAIVRQKLEEGIQQQIGTNNRIAHFLGYLVGFDMAGSPHVAGLLTDPQQLSAQARQLFQEWITKLCAIDPTLIELEDVHYADKVSLDLLTSVMNQSKQLPLLIVYLARPELYVQRPAWGSGLRAHTQLKLRPLSKRESCYLIEALLEKVDDIPQKLHDLLTEHAEGNPYYLEEMIRMLIDERIIVKDNDRTWRIEETRLERWQIPATLTWLIQARLDTLLYPERVVLQRAAVIGRVFYDTALISLNANDETDIDDLRGILKLLTTHGFIYAREITTFMGSDEYVFANTMMRDVLLHTLLPQQKRTYNLAAANWLIEIGADRAEEHDNVIATYYQEAGNLEEAASYWQRAGDRALRVSAFEGAKNLFEQALALLSEIGADNSICCLKLGETHYWLSEYTMAKKRLKQACATSEENNNLPQQATALYWLSQVAVGEGAYAEAQEYLERGLPLARADSDETILAHVLFGLGDLQWRQGKFEPAQRNCVESLTLSRRLENMPSILRALNRLGAIAMSSAQVAQAQQLYAETYALAQQTGNRIYAASALNNLGEIEKTAGDLPAAQRHYQEALAITNEAGQRNFTALLHINLATVAIALRDEDSARRHLHDGLSVSSQIGAMPTILSAIQKFAWLLLREGADERGLALLRLAWQHPAADSESKREIQEIATALDLQLDALRLEDVLLVEQGMGLTAVITDILNELGNH